MRAAREFIACCPARQRRLVAIAMLSFSALPSVAVGLAEDSADDIVRRCELDKAERLREYLQARPQATDRLAAVEELVKVYLRFGTREERNQALEEKLALVMAAPRVEPKDYFNTLGMLVQLNVLEGNRGRAEELVRQARTASDKHPQRDMLTGMIDQLSIALRRPATGQKLEFAFQSLQGHAVDLAALKGKVVFVHFWATTCGPCLRELPALEKLYEKHHGEGLEFVGISLDDDIETVKRFIAQRRTPWPEHCDGRGWQSELAKRYGVFSLPSTFLLDREGKVVAADLSGEQLEEAVVKELGKRK